MFSYLLMNINDLGAMAIHRTPSHPSNSTSGSPGFIRQFHDGNGKSPKNRLICILKRHSWVSEYDLPVLCNLLYVSKQIIRNLQGF